MDGGARMSAGLSHSGHGGRNAEPIVARDQVVTLHLAQKDDTPPRAGRSGGVRR